MAILLAGCSQKRKTETSGQVTTADSLTITTLGQQEQATWAFYQQLEAAMREDKEIEDEKIDEYIQTLIDEGSIPRPEIFMRMANGTKSKIVDYKTYKKFRVDNPIDLGNHYVISLRTSDSLSEDSLRKSLIEALKTDSIE